VTPGGQYEWVTCPFDLSNAPSYFQPLTNDILHEHIAAGYCVCYCNDLLICTASDDPAEHLLKLMAVLDTLQEPDLLIKGSKSELMRSQVEFLGFNVSAGMVPDRVQVVGCLGLASTRNGETPALIPGNGRLLPLIHACLFKNGSASHRPAQGLRRSKVQLVSGV